MNKFLKYLFFFSIPIFVGMFVAECLLRSVPNPYKYKYEWMQENAKNVELLVFGSSHTFYGIRPEFFCCKAFNLANVSQGLEMDLYLLEYWSDKYEHLNTIILPISYSTCFGKGLQYGKESYRCRYYTIYMDCHIYRGLKNCFELSDYRTAKEKWKKVCGNNVDLGYDEYGYGTTSCLSRKSIERWNNGSEAAEAVERHRAKSWDNITMNYGRMKVIAEWCEEHEVRLVLITTPCWKSYYGNLNDCQLKKMYGLIRDLQTEYGIEYYDFLKDSRFDEDDFYDSNHLSEYGAEKFTKILNDTLLLH